MEEINALVKTLPKQAWFNNTAKQVFIERALFLKEKGLTLEEIKDTLSLLYISTALNHGYSEKKMA